MARKAPTAEQKAKAAERRERFKKLAKQVAEMTAEQREDLAARAGIVTVKLHHLSPFNQCLIMSQFPTASMVGGFRQWLAAGRQVKKGATGLSLWVPVGRGVSKANEDIARDASAEADESGGRSRGGAFIMGTVFDVSQTEPRTLAESLADTDKLVESLME